MGFETPKQRRTRSRNWKIFQLRGMWHNVSERLFSDSRRVDIRRLIDDQLEELGAERESLRIERMRQFWYGEETRKLSDEEYDKAWRKVRKPFGGSNV